MSERKQNMTRWCSARGKLKEKLRQKWGKEEKGEEERRGKKKKPEKIQEVRKEEDCFDNVVTFERHERISEKLASLEKMEMEEASEISLLEEIYRFTPYFVDNCRDKRLRTFVKIPSEKFTT